MIQGIGTVIYKVSDLEKAKQWYADAFTVAPYFDEPFYVGFNVGGFELGLDPDCPSTVVAGDTITYWRVDNLQREHQRFLALGAKEGEAPKHVGHDIHVSIIIDPFNNKIGLIQNPHFRISEVK